MAECVPVEQAPLVEEKLHELELEQELEAGTAIVPDSRGSSFDDSTLVPFVGPLLTNRRLTEHRPAGSNLHGLTSLA